MSQYYFYECETFGRIAEDKIPVCMKFQLSTKWLITKFHSRIYTDITTCKYGYAPVLWILNMHTHTYTHKTTPALSLYFPLSIQNDSLGSQWGEVVSFFFRLDILIKFYFHIFFIYPPLHKFVLACLLIQLSWSSIFLQSSFGRDQDILTLVKLQNIFTPNILSSARFVSVWFSLLGMFIPHSVNKLWFTAYHVPGTVLDVVNREVNETDVAPACTASTD